VNYSSGIQSFWFCLLTHFWTVILCLQYFLFCTQRDPRINIEEMETNENKNMLVTSLMRDSESSGILFGLGEERRVENHMSSDLEERRIRSETELKEEQIDLLLPELCFLFRIAGIPVKKSDPMILNVIVFVFMWVIDILMIGVYLKHAREDENPHFSHLVEIYWAFHSCVIYSILSQAMYRDSQVFHMILLSAQSEVNEWRCSMISMPSISDQPNVITATSTQKSLRKHSKICVYIVILCVTFNFLVNAHCHSLGRILISTHSLERIDILQFSGSNCLVFLLFSLVCGRCLCIPSSALL
jgi:hypothetical protein